MKKPIKKVTPQPKMGEVIQSRKDGQQRFDGWQNLVTLMGTGGDKRMHSELYWDLRPPEFYEQLYAGGGIPARIVDLIPDESLRRWVDWLNVSKKESEELEERCQELDLRGAFLRAWKWGRAYGGGLLHIVTDTSDPASPLEPGEKVIGLRDLSRWDVRILTTDVEYDFGSPNFGHPRIYYLNVQMGAQYKGYPIHWTRMIRFDGQLVPRRTFIRNNYWHDSVLNRIYNSIRNYETSNDTAASALQDFNVDVYKLNNVAAMIGAGKEHLVKNRIEMMAFTKSTINAMILDTKDEEYENKGRSLEGVAELLVHQANRLVAETDIPHTKLLGESPDGSNATGNSTTQQWYNFIDSERENYAKPKLHRLINILFPDKKDLGFKFKPLRVLDDVETADLRYKIAQTDDIYLTQQVLDPSEVTESRFGSDEYSMETKLDTEARASGLIGAQEDPEGGDEEEGPGGLGGGPGSGGKAPGSMGQEGKGRKAGTPFQTTGDQPPEGRKKKEPKPSDETEEGNQTKGKKGSDLSGKGKASLDSEEVSETSFEAGMGESEFEFRNEVIPIDKPKTQSFISQTESLPFRDPKSDQPMKGPGIPNKARSFLPTRGNGVTAQSGFDFQKDAGQKGSNMEITQIEPNKAKNDSAEERNRAATIIVKRDGKFLMGKRRDNEKWSLPGGHVENMESHHQGAIRELMEETGIQAKRLKFEGGRMVEPKKGQSVHVNMYSHNALDSDKPTWKIDPDKEFKEFKWFSQKDPLPEEVSGSLQHPNNVALMHLGLLK
jgi:phage-related protein (TIGR01555 family)